MRTVNRREVRDNGGKDKGHIKQRDSILDKVGSIWRLAFYNTLMALGFLCLLRLLRGKL